MTPRNRQPYRAPRNRREVVTAVAVGMAILIMTALIVWALAPDTSTPAPVTTTTNTPSASTTTTVDPNAATTTTTTAAGG